MTTASLILVIDDDPDILKLVRTALRSQGHEVLTAANGIEGLEAAEQHRPDVIVTDVMMPGMDGWELVRQLRAQAQFGLVPVIFLTALGSGTDHVRGFGLGADDYVAKPFHIGELTARVGKAVRHRAQLRNVLRLKQTATRHETPDLAGSLDQIGLATVLGILDLERKTGTLTLTYAPPGPALVARIRVREGCVVAIACADPVALRGEEALLELLERGSGTFAFTACEVLDQAEIEGSTQQLLLRVARRIDESRRAEHNRTLHRA
ncbi:MAG: response regulator [Deltaproteobacteria bacterium]